MLSSEPTELVVNKITNETSKPSPTPVNNNPTNVIILFCVNDVNMNPNAQTSKLTGTIHFFNFKYTREKANPLRVEPKVEIDKPKAVTNGAILFLL